MDAAFSEMSTIGKTLTNSTVAQQFAFRSKADMELPSVEAYYLNEAVNSFKQKEFEIYVFIFPNSQESIMDGTDWFLRIFI